jgi:transketolase
MDKKLKRRLLDLLYEHQEEHVGSCFSCVEIIDEIFKKKEEDDIFILSNGHAAYALYTIIEKYYGVNADSLVAKHGSHPNWDEENKIFCSTGSLGSGILIATGRALANKNRKVYVMLSDGECAEGSVWEALRIINEKKIENIEVHVNANGFACYDEIDLDYLEKRLKSFLPNIFFHRTSVNTLSFLSGLSAHYVKINEDQYQETIKILENECP